MIKTVLAHLSGTDRDASVLETSLRIVKPYLGHIDCLRVTPDPVALVAQAAQLDLGTSMVLADTLTAIEQRGRERTQRAHAAMVEFCRREDIVNADAPPAPAAITASWCERPGDDLEQLISQARFHDLVVLAGEGDSFDGLSPAEVGEIVIRSGRPVVLASKNGGKSPLKTIAIAWKDSPEAARAVMASMPLLAKAQRVEIFGASEGDSKAADCVQCSENIVKHLRWHGVNAQAHFVIPAGRSIPDAILESATGRGADLLVMGGYGHSRLREFVFGGFTQRILQGAELPVFLFH